MEIPDNLNLPIEGVVNLSMWMYFFKDRFSPNSSKSWCSCQALYPRKFKKEKAQTKLE